jgi:hypothetical protein
MIALLKPFNESSFMRPIKVTKDQWNRLIANPMVLEDKHTAPLIIFGNMTPQVELDAESGFPRCIANNVEKLYALSVDVDNGLPMADFERTFHRYAYQMYTTYSWHNGKEGDRYRVVFPLKEHLMIKWLEGPVKRYLLDFFNMADPTCFDRGHWQVLPCVQSREKDYRYVQHQGELLSFAHKNFEQMWKEYKEEAHWKREIAEADKDPSANHTGALNYVQKIFDETTEGSRNRTCFAKIKWLHETVGCTYDEVICLRAPRGYDDDYIKMVDREYGYR